jgi:hypothetical protein
MTMTTTAATQAGFPRFCSLLLLGNLLDGLFTFAFLQLGYVQEANPLMRWMYGHSPLAFMVFKLCTVQLGMLILWMHRCRRAAVLGLQMTAGIYATVVAYHCSIALSLPV